MVHAEMFAGTVLGLVICSAANVGVVSATAAITNERTPPNAACTAFCLKRVFVVTNAQKMETQRSKASV
jgi:hypothetical protein